MIDALPWPLLLLAAVAVLPIALAVRGVAYRGAYGAVTIGLAVLGWALINNNPFNRTTRELGLMAFVVMIGCAMATAAYRPRKTP